VFSPITAEHGARRVRQYHHSGLRVSRPKSVYTSLAQNSATLLEKGEVDLQQAWSDLDLHPPVETFIILPW